LTWHARSLHAPSMSSLAASMSADAFRCLRNYRLTPQ
jgi:hypothetical protein